VRRALIVPAAGAGSRLEGDVPKLLAPVGGRPMIDIVLDLYRKHTDTIVVVIHPSADARVRDHLRGAATEAVSVLWQPKRTGMLDAVLIPHETLAHNPPDQIWITWCDQVAVDPATIDRLADHASRPQTDVVLPVAYTRQPYTCLERDADGRLKGILHQREGDAIPEWGEREMGVFALSRRAYFELLPQFARTGETGAVTGERNFLPFLPWVAARGRLTSFRCADPREAIGVNTPEDRTQVEAFLEERRTTPRPVSG
jgi:bifunctional UDP-N-acetylglucosamine pyrophosphorylase/glucosamine-1-phosphate N-acetyltransferase